MKPNLRRQIADRYRAEPAFKEAVDLVHKHSARGQGVRGRALFRKLEEDLLCMCLMSSVGLAGRCSNPVLGNMVKWDMRRVSRVLRRISRRHRESWTRSKEKGLPAPLDPLFEMRVSKPVWRLKGVSRPRWDSRRQVDLAPEAEVEEKTLLKIRERIRLGVEALRACKTTEEAILALMGSCARGHLYVRGYKDLALLLGEKYPNLMPFSPDTVGDSVRRLRNDCKLLVIKISTAKPDPGRALLLLGGGQDNPNRLIRIDPALLTRPFSGTAAPKLVTVDPAVEAIWTRHGEHLRDFMGTDGWDDALEVSGKKPANVEQREALLKLEEQLLRVLISSEPAPCALTNSDLAKRLRWELLRVKRVLHRLRSQGLKSTGRGKRRRMIIRIEKHDDYDYCAANFGAKLPASPIEPPARCPPMSEESNAKLGAYLHDEALALVGGIDGLAELVAGMPGPRPIDDVRVVAGVGLAAPTAEGEVVELEGHRQDALDVADAEAPNEGGGAPPDAAPFPRLESHLVDCVTAFHRHEALQSQPAPASPSPNMDSAEVAPGVGWRLQSHLVDCVTAFHRHEALQSQPQPDSPSPSMDSAEVAPGVGWRLQSHLVDWSTLCQRRQALNAGEDLEPEDSSALVRPEPPVPPAESLSATSHCRAHTGTIRDNFGFAATESQLRLLPGAAAADSRLSPQVVAAFPGNRVRETLSGSGCPSQRPVSPPAGAPLPDAGPQHGAESKGFDAGDVVERAPLAEARRAKQQALDELYPAPRPPGFSSSAAWRKYRAACTNLATEEWWLQFNAPRSTG